MVVEGVVERSSSCLLACYLSTGIDPKKAKIEKTIASIPSSLGELSISRNLHLRLQSLIP